MLKAKIQKALNHQINREFYSAYLYLGMAAYAHSIGLTGFANWFKVQFREELQHADKIYDYLNKQGARVILEAVERPPQDFSSGRDLFEKTLAHEKNVTRMIEGLVELAESENDTLTEDFLQWFIKEQAEEEATPAKILQDISSLGEDRAGLAKVDRQLAARK